MPKTLPSEASPEQLAQAAALVRPARRVAVLTGAGVSAESGLATFRGSGGLWEGQPVEEVATPSAFRRDPARVWRFYHARRAVLQTASPNPGHHALAQWEKYLGEGFTLITQNVDGLHQLAGSRRVLELHGSLRRVRCTECGQREECGTAPLPELPRCSACGALLRPDVVWFGEALPAGIWEQALAAAQTCEVFVVVGTSAVVYPAAGLADLARQAGAALLEINLEPTPLHVQAHLSLYGRAGQLLPALVTRLRASEGENSCL